MNVEFCIFNEKVVPLDQFASTEENSICIPCAYFGLCTSKKYKLLALDNSDLESSASRGTHNSEGFQTQFEDFTNPNAIGDNEEDEEEEGSGEKLDYLEDADGDAFLDESNIDEEEDGEAEQRKEPVEKKETTNKIAPKPTKEKKPPVAKPPAPPAPPKLTKQEKSTASVKEAADSFDF
jgi:hypothetical protein